MINLLRSEMFKVIRNRSFFWLNILMIFFAGFVIMLAVLDEYGLLDHIDNITVEVESEVVFSGTDFLLYMIEAPELFLVFFYIAVLGEFFIANEYTIGTMKNLVSAGYARWQVYLAKLIVFILSSLFIFAVLLFACTLFGSLFFGIGEWPGDQSIVHISKTLVLIVLLIISIVSIVMIFSLVTTNSGVSLLTSLLFYFAFSSGLNMLSNQYKVAQSLTKYSVFERFSSVYDNALQMNSFIETGIIACLTMLIATIIGIVLFQRKDIA
ncbi:MAG TPA: ABC transporter permease subunit [Bacillota bacterium]|nr:ABC transporter permease subunit [Bacillota bacterium]